MARALDFAWYSRHVARSVVELQRIGEWALVRRIRETRVGTHWQTTEGFLLVELPVELAETPAQGSAFMRDAEVFAAISHAGIARVLDTTIAGEVSYVVLDAPKGVTLRELEEKVPVPPEVMARILLDALAAIAFAHDNGAIFGDLDADSILITKRGHVVLLPTCSRAGAASDEDDVAALGRLAGTRGIPQTARLLAHRLRRQAAIADRDFVGRFVSRAFIHAVGPAPRVAAQRLSAPPPRLSPPPPRLSAPARLLASMPTRRSAPPPPPRPMSQSASEYDDVTPALPIELRHSRVFHELSADDLIPIEIEELAIPVYVEEPPDPRDTERPVVFERPAEEFFPRAAKSRRVPVIATATLCVACALVGHVLWRGASTLLPARFVAPAPGAEPLPAMQAQAPAALQQPALEPQLASATVTNLVPTAATEADAAAPSNPAATTVERGGSNFFPNEP